MTTEQLDTVAFLNMLLECERAGAKALRHFQTQDPPPVLAASLPALTKDEARYCAGLTRHITRLGGVPSPRTGGFLETVLAAEGWGARLDLLVRGQRWVAKRIAERMETVEDAELATFLIEMHDTHLLNIAEVQDIASAVQAG
ncbi:MAG TPA: DUF6306 domain-containing protein [Candidatus Sulfotelmatobacter sp.]|jgi:hypothetical protein|nr:DUF6306 domain-containing protein [Candidatus Sulfotelmatobacter sp.]